MNKTHTASEKTYVEGMMWTYPLAMYPIFCLKIDVLVQTFIRNDKNSNSDFPKLKIDEIFEENVNSLGHVDKYCMKSQI